MLSRLWACERGALWVITPRDVAPPIAPIPAGTTFAQVGPGAADELARVMGVGAGEVERRMASSQCVVARVDGEIASYGWVSRGDERIGEIERRLRLKPGEAYIWDCATLAPYRRRGLYVALLIAIVTTLASEGANRIWIGASRSNLPSLQGFARAGFQPALTITYLRLASARHSWLTPAPGASPALTRAARWALGEGPDTRAEQERERVHG